MAGTDGVQNIRSINETLKHATACRKNILRMSKRSTNSGGNTMPFFCVS